MATSQQDPPAEESQPEPEQTQEPEQSEPDEGPVMPIFDAPDEEIEIVEPVMPFTEGVDAPVPEPEEPVMPFTGDDAE